MLPNFIVIGAGKAGTTSLYGYLSDHPQVFMSDPKELNFFTIEDNWHLGLPWYERHFEGASGARAIGEASGNYANWPEYAGVPERMAGVVPDAQLVYVIRDPVERMESAYRYMRVLGAEHQPMEEAFRERPIYMNVSRYALQIEQYLQHYPRERLLVIVSEDLRGQREATMRRVFSFLDVDTDVILPTLDREYNSTSSLNEPRMALRLARMVPGYHRFAAKAPAKMKRSVLRVASTKVLDEGEERLTDDLRERLRGAMREDTSRLRQYLGDDFHGWGWA